jgi:hypothetical protein
MFLKRSKFFAKLHKLYKKARTSRNRKSYNVHVKNYYEKNKPKNFAFIKNIWSNNYLWDHFLQSLPHSIKSKYYVPADYYAFEIESKLNKEFKSFCLEKNMFEKMFSNCGVKLPVTILRCMNGIYLDRNYAIIDDIKGVCEGIREDIIIKPTVQSCCGKGIRKYLFVKNTLYYGKTREFDIEEIAKYYKGNFIIQGIVNQNSETAKFHPYSLNTIRAFSYRSVRTNETHVTIAMFRMGINGSYLDNASIDGIACGIRQNGTLMKYAFDQFGNYCACHPNTKVKFENFKVPSFNRVIKDIKRLANIIPHQRLVGWDFGIDKKRNPVLIELNIGTGTWMLQIANGRPLFGDYSQEVKDYMDFVK